MSTVRPSCRILLMIALATLSACGSHTPQHAKRFHNYAPSRYYPPPGPTGDPWGPYIREASGRFGVPEIWIRRVMRQESGGQEDVISSAGAMGLMQVMPDTYADLRDRYGLGDDPYDPRNNILAGTAYLRLMYDRYGAPGFLAAYNAGPNRLDRYLTNGTPLPDETVNYVASLAPQLGAETPMSGPLAVYAGAWTYAAATRRPSPAGCDPDAAYNPDGPCTPLRPVEVAYAPAAVPPCDPDAAYDPARPCRYGPLVPAMETRPMQERLSHLASLRPVSAPGQWGIQVGAFASLATAQSRAETARATLPDLLSDATIVLPPTTPLGTQVAFRARLIGLTQSAAAGACAQLSGRGMACLTVPPGG